MAGDCPDVFFTSEHVIPVLMEHKIMASSLRACDSMITHAEVGWVPRVLARKNYPPLDRVRKKSLL